MAIEGTGIKSPSKTASRMAMTGDSFNESDYQSYLKALGIKYPRTLSPTFNRMMRENYQQDKKEGIYKDGQIFNQGGTLLNRAPDKKEIDTGSAIKEEKPTIGERVASFTGDLFNAFTGTQSAVAQTKEIGDQIFESGIDSNAYKDKRIFRGGGIRNDKGQVVTLGKNPSSDSGEEKDNTEGPFSFLKAKPIVREEGQTSVRTNKGSGVDNEEPFAADKVGTVDLQSKEYLDVKRINEQVSATKRPIETDSAAAGAEAFRKLAKRPIETDSAAAGAEAFRKAEAFKEAQGIAKRNPNVSVGVDSKGQPKATATNDSGEARAQAAAVNRKLAGKSISQVKAANKQSMRDRAEARNETFKKTKKSTVGQRREAAKRAMQARARARHKAFKKKRTCDIFLKYNIAPLTNMNLVRDDLAEVAYFVKEIQEK